jgi:SAM-dependent methyltransferase
MKDKPMRLSLEGLRRHLTARYWARAFARGGIATWMGEPVARRYVNESVTGDPNVWPMEWFRSRYAAVPFDRGVSFGCGDGALERDLRRKEICRAVTGIDISAGALAQARDRARQEGLEGIAYERGDLNHLELDGRRFDIAFFHQSLHHVAELKDCLRRVSDALTAGGLVYLDEYVGPSRRQWRRELLREAEETLASVPARLRRRIRLHPPVDRRDPSEGIRSSEILGTAEKVFDPIELRPYGGNLFALVYPELRLDGASPEERETVLRGIAERERELLAAGAPPFCAVLVAQRRGRTA